MGFSFLTTIVQMRELQLFFGIIIVGILVYVLISLLQPFFKWFLQLFKSSEKKKRSSALYDLDDIRKGRKPKIRYKEHGTISWLQSLYHFSSDYVEVDEKTLFTITINQILLERAIFGIIIIIEVLLIYWKAVQ